MDEGTVGSIDQWSVRVGDYWSETAARVGTVDRAIVGIVLGIVSVQHREEVKISLSRRSLVQGLDGSTTCQSNIVCMCGVQTSE